MCIRDRSNCPLARFLDILGDKWTLLVMREVVAFEKTTFKEIIQMPEHISSNILALRLDRLVKIGLLTKTQSSRNKNIYHYFPTETAFELLPMVLQMREWAEKRLFDPHESPALLPEQLIALLKNMPSGG